MPDTYLTLGGYTFDGFGVPDKINGGGAHRLEVHKMLGGARVIDALGADDDTIKFRGRFRGANAMDDAMFMDAMRRAGAAVTLSYWNQTATVVVEKFTFSFERFYEVPYELECVVVSNQAQQQESPDDTTDSAVSSDIYQGAGAAAGNPDCAAAFNSLPTAYAANGPLDGIASAVGGAVNTAEAAVSDAATAVQSTLGAIAQAADVVLQPINDVVAGVNGIAAGLIDPLAAAANLTGFAGIMSAGATAQITLPFARRISLNLSASTGLSVGVQ